MAHEILSVKLYELDKKICQVHTHIQMSESANHAQIQMEVDELQRECATNEMMLRDKLRFSKAGVVAKLAKSYDEVEQIIQKVKEEMGGPASVKEMDELSMEEKILLAEYALDFAMQAADHALLISMEALDAHMTQQEKEEGKKS